MKIVNNIAKLIVSTNKLRLEMLAPGKIQNPLRICSLSNDICIDVSISFVIKVSAWIQHTCSKSVWVF